MKRNSGPKPDIIRSGKVCEAETLSSQQHAGRVRRPAWALMLAGLGLVSAACPGLAQEPESHARVEWLRSDTEAFAKARSEHRFVLLYLEAVWCHWCHVMDDKTYGDAAIRKEIDAHYIPLRIDQDLRPDLSNRYKDYGWPATIVFAADGSEIVKRQGFVEPERFLRLLKAIEADPSPEVADSVDRDVTTANRGALDDKTRAELVKRHQDTHDHELGGLTTGQKYLDRDSVEYELALAHSGDAANAAMAIRTLDAARALFDPAWGGVYQYSTFSDWKHPHYEKLAIVQAQYLRIYALAYATLARESDRQAAVQIRRYIDAFLKSPDGAFHVSQDADLKPGEHSDAYFSFDDAHRHALGVPRVDRHLYSLQNGQIIEALATWSELGGDTEALAEALRAAQWIIANRALPDGGFSHDASDAAGPYLGDTLAMGRAFLALYRATAERAWLARANAAAQFIARNFGTQDGKHAAGDPASTAATRSKGGYVSARSSGPIAATPQIDENISLARFANLLAHYSGDATAHATAEAALSYLVDPRVALSEITEPGILLADDELHADPLHLTIMGAKSDPGAKVLFSTVQHLPPWYKRVEWWDRGEGELPNPDVSYPPTKRAAAFVCTANRCSLPIFMPEEIVPFLRDSNATKKPLAMINTMATLD